MARPLRQLTPEANALWDDVLARYEAGYVNIDDLVKMIGFSERTIYSRLGEARLRLADRQIEEAQDRKAAKQNPSGPEPSDSDRPGAEVDEATFLTIVDDPRDAMRLVRDYSTNKGHGEVIGQIRHYYNLADDSTSLDAVGGAVLVGSRNGASCVGGMGGHRAPTVRLEGQKLRRTRLGVGKTRNDTEKPKSEGRHTNDEDKKKGVKFAQVATKARVLKGGLG